jgi:DNA-binding NarL/FixJ family response regulator
LAGALSPDHARNRGAKLFASVGVCTVIGRSARLSKIRVLLADDSVQILEYVRDFLSANCCEVVGAVVDGQAAVVAAAQLQPDVVVLDLLMPVYNGIEAAERILEAKPSAKIVLLTVEKDTDTCRAALEAGACGYVLKPRLASDLIPAIELAKDGRRFVSPGCQ